MTLFLSIIIPAYNAEPFIERCIRSCEAQDISCDKYEIIVVDDGSTDATKDIVTRLSVEFENIRYIYQENARQGAARNNGLRNAHGDCIWYVDADDWISPNCLLGILSRINTNNLEGLAVGHATHHASHVDKWRSFDESRIMEGKDMLANGIYLISPTYTIWQREYMLRNNIFYVERQFHEDTEMVPRMYYPAQRVGFWNEVCYNVLWNMSSTTREVPKQRPFDLVKACCSLSRFVDSIDDARIINTIRYYIAVSINAALYNTYKMNVSDISDLDRHLYDNRHLFYHLLKASGIKYRVEGLLFLLFPSHSSDIYRLMQKFNPRPGDGIHNITE